MAQLDAAPPTKYIVTGGLGLSTVAPQTNRQIPLNHHYFKFMQNELIEYEFCIVYKRIHLILVQRVKAFDLLRNNSYNQMIA